MTFFRTSPQAIGPQGPSTDARNTAAQLPKANARTANPLPRPNVAPKVPQRHGVEISSANQSSARAAPTTSAGSEPSKAPASPGSTRVPSNPISAEVPKNPIPAGTPETANRVADSVSNEPRAEDGEARAKRWVKELWSEQENASSYDASIMFAPVRPVQNPNPSGSPVRAPTRQGSTATPRSPMSGTPDGVEDSASNRTPADGVPDCPSVAPHTSNAGQEGQERPLAPDQTSLEDNAEYVTRYLDDLVGRVHAQVDAEQSSERERNAEPQSPIAPNSPSVAPPASNAGQERPVAPDQTPLEDNAAYVTRYLGDLVGRVQAQVEADQSSQAERNAEPQTAIAPNRPSGAPPTSNAGQETAAALDQTPAEDHEALAKRIVLEAVTRAKSQLDLEQSPKSAANAETELRVPPNTPSVAPPMFNAGQEVAVASDQTPAEDSAAPKPKRDVGGVLADSPMLSGPPEGPAPAESSPNSMSVPAEAPPVPAGIPANQVPPTSSPAREPATATPAAAPQRSSGVSATPLLADVPAGANIASAPPTQISAGVPPGPDVAESPASFMVAREPETPIRGGDTGGLSSRGPATAVTANPVAGEASANLGATGVPASAVPVEATVTSAREKGTTSSTTREPASAIPTGTTGVPAGLQAATGMGDAVGLVGPRDCLKILDKPPDRPSKTILFKS